MSNFDVSESIQAQKEYCERTGSPHFAPFTGNCWNCNKNIYEPNEKGFGITTKEAASELITGCPHCFRSYCD